MIGISNAFKSLARAYAVAKEPLLNGVKSIVNSVDLPVFTSLYQLLLIMQTLFTFFTKQATLMTRSTDLVDSLY
jgi:hypothetical protein